MGDKGLRAQGSGQKAKGSPPGGADTKAPLLGGAGGGLRNGTTA